MKPTILVVNPETPSGRRYIAICEYLRCRVIRRNEDDKFPLEKIRFDKAIICGNNQLSLAVELAQHKKDFIVELPITKDPDDLQALNDLCRLNKITGSVMNNWSFVLKNQTLQPGKHEIFLNHYTEEPTDLWQFCQIVYLSKKFVIKFFSPTLRAFIDKVPITYANIEYSYINLINLWLGGSSCVWTLKSGIEAVKKVKLILQVNGWKE